MKKTYLAITHIGGYKAKLIDKEILLKEEELDNIKVISWEENNSSDMINSIYYFFTRNAILNEEDLVKELKQYNVYVCGTRPTVMEIKNKISSDYQENLKFMFYLKDYLNISDTEFKILRYNVAKTTAKQFEFLNKISFKEVINRRIRKINNKRNL